MLKTILIFLMAVLLTLSSASLADAQSKKRSKKVVTKTAAVKKVTRSKPRIPVDPAELARRKQEADEKMYGPARPTGEISPEVAAFLKQPPPKDKYVFPKTKQSLMTRLVCSQGKYMWISTENSIISFVGIAIRLDYGLLKAMSPNATYQNVADVVSADASSVKDVQFAKRIMTKVAPKELIINPSRIELEKVGLRTEDTEAILEALQDHLGDDVELKVSPFKECFLNDAPSKAIASKSS